MPIRSFTIPVHSKSFKIWVSKTQKMDQPYSEAYKKLKTGPNPQGKHKLGRRKQTQSCHFDVTQNLSVCEKNSEYTEKNLNLATKIALLNRNLYQVQSQKKIKF